MMRQAIYLPVMLLFPKNACGEAGEGARKQIQGQQSQQFLKILKMLRHWMPPLNQGQQEKSNKILPRSRKKRTRSSLSV